MSADSASITEEPLRVVQRWIERAATRGLRRNPSSMALATIGERGHPSARMVLLKGLEAEPGYVVFFTNYRSRKARELERNAWAAGVLYWEEFGCQVRLEGPVVRSPADESDAYFASRPFLSQLNAWVSEQSEPLDDIASLEQRAAAMAVEYEPAPGSPPAQPRIVPRPPFWGGYRLWCEAVELWNEGSGRFHKRLRYERELMPDRAADFRGGPWRMRLLQP
jgi:pyridoxamine 5'-phosphate oxidase